MNVIITGASRGIGFEIVKIFCKNTDCNIIALSRKTESLDKLKKSENLSNLQIVPFDLNQPNQVEQLKKKLNINKVDILINNAGYLVNKSFRALSNSDLNAIYQTNVLGPFQLIQTLLPLLEKAPVAHIVNIGSMGGFQGSSKFPGLSAYSSSKAAIANLTECLAEELRDTKIKVNCLALGAVNTEMLAEAFPGFKADVTPKQMATFIHDFALSKPVMFNGKILPVSISTP